MIWHIRSLAFLAVLTGISTVSAQTDDHLVLDQAKSLYGQSSFAHGYRHGYEEGFHIGDQDLQMGRRVRVCDKISEYKQARTHFKQTFGDKPIFEKGYRQGFSRGYEDAFSGREFQAVKGGRVAALGLTSAAFNGIQLHAFDSGFTTGYELAWKNSMRNGAADLEYLTQHCERTADPKLKERESFCQGYARGLLFGAAQNGDFNSAVVARNLTAH